MAAKRGRPALKSGEESVSINVREPKSSYDKLQYMAAEEGVSVPELLRRGGWRTDRSLPDRVAALEAKLNPPRPPRAKAVDFSALVELTMKKVAELRAA